MCPRVAAVPMSSFPASGKLPNALGAPTLIGVGLALLIAASWWPGAPVVTAMSVITLGATIVTLARLRGTAALVPVMILHGTTYVGLYGLFIAATCRVASSASAGSVPCTVVLDVAASALPMGIALQRISTGLLQSIRPNQ